jgi:hypothetical protein
VGTVATAGEGGADGPSRGEEGGAPTGGGGGQPPEELGGAGSDGGAGQPPVVEPGANDRLGMACVNDAQCEAGLQCITATSGLLGGGSPPKGVCSKPCTNDDTCSATSPGALCYPFGDAGDAGYCMEGCSFGDPGVAPKCHGRPEFACMPALLGSTNEPCGSNGCEPGEVCTDGLCHVVFAACLPTCRGDLDCATGLHCDQTFLGGTCVAQKPVGKPLGAPCTVPGPDEPAEPDGCIGFCQADSAVGNAGHCATTCGLGYECAWEPVTEQFGGACLYASALTEELGSIGDFGFCAPACNCTDQCNDAALTCNLLEQGPLSGDFAGPGLCFEQGSGGEELEDCP